MNYFGLMKLVGYVLVYFGKGKQFNYLLFLV